LDDARRSHAYRCDPQTPVDRYLTLKRNAFDEAGNHALPAFRSLSGLASFIEDLTVSAKERRS
jgi:hypothetical protein